MKSMGTMRLRWMVKQDLERVIDIQRVSSAKMQGWCSKRYASELVDSLRKRNVESIVVEKEDPSGLIDNPLIIIGFAVFALQMINNRDTGILQLSVDPSFRRQGAGSLLDKWVFHRTEHKAAVEACVSERCLESQLFLRKQGYKCVGILPELFLGDDGYRFRREDCTASQLFDDVSKQSIR